MSIHKIDFTISMKKYSYKKNIVILFVLVAALSVGVMKIRDSTNDNSAQFEWELQSVFPNYSEFGSVGNEMHELAFELLRKYPRDGAVGQWIDSTVPNPIKLAKTHNYRVHEVAKLASTTPKDVWRDFKKSNPEIAKAISESGGVIDSDSFALLGEYSEEIDYSVSVRKFVNDVVAEGRRQGRFDKETTLRLVAEGVVLTVWMLCSLDENTHEVGGDCFFDLTPAILGWAGDDENHIKLLNLLVERVAWPTAYEEGRISFLLTTCTLIRGVHSREDVPGIQTEHVVDPLYLECVKWGLAEGIRGKGFEFDLFHSYSQAGDSLGQILVMLLYFPQKLDEQWLLQLRRSCKNLDENSSAALFEQIISILHNSPEGHLYAARELLMIEGARLLENGENRMAIERFREANELASTKRSKKLLRQVKQK